MSLTPPNLRMPHRHFVILLDIIKAICPTCEVWAYGSRVCNGANNKIFDGTDLDLVVLGESPPIDDLKHALADCNIPYPIDVTGMHHLPDSFKHEIRKKYVVVHNGGAV